MNYALINELNNVFSPVRFQIVSPNVIIYVTHSTHMFYFTWCPIDSNKFSIQTMGCPLMHLQDDLIRARFKCHYMLCYPSNLVYCRQTHYSPYWLAQVLPIWRFGKPHRRICSTQLRVSSTVLLKSNNGYQKANSNLMTARHIINGCTDILNSEHA